MKFKKNLPYDIQYCKAGEVTQRKIIPTTLPSPNIKAIDVSDVSQMEQDKIVSHLEEYTEYVEQHLKTLFSFEDWISHTNRESVFLKWRTFNIDNIVNLKD